MGASRPLGPSSSKEELLPYHTIRDRILLCVDGARCGDLKATCGQQRAVRPFEPLPAVDLGASA
eukprot:1141594-Pleurochrysis_carterae.AAC.1